MCRTKSLTPSSMSNDQSLSVTIKLYSILRERDGQIIDHLELDLPPDSRISDVLRLLDIPDDLDVVLALNDEIAEETAVLRDQDHLAIIPAVAGGAIKLQGRESA